jgi:hypothetical protein
MFPNTPQAQPRQETDRGLDARFRVGMSQLRDGADPSPDIPPRIFTFVT